MGDALLMLDDLHVPYELIGKCLGRPVFWMGNVEAAAWELAENPSQYGAVTVEPFICYKNIRQQEDLQKFMRSAREEHHLPVVVFSTQDELEIKDTFMLLKGTHYDAFSTKWGAGSADRFKATLETLLNQPVSR